MSRQFKTSGTLFVSSLIAGWLFSCAAGLAQKQQAENQATEQEVEYARLKEEFYSFRNASNLDAAARTLERIIEVERDLFGPTHEEVLSSLNILAQIHLDKSDFAAARNAYEEALAIKRQLHGDEHWQATDARLNVEYAARLVAMSPEQRRELQQAVDENQRAGELYGKGKSRDAVQLALQALERRRTVLGAEHPLTAQSLNNLATFYLAMGDYARAEPLYRQSLAIRKKTLGEEHPDTAQSLYNLALLYRLMGDYARAEPLYRQSLAIRQKTLGADHPDTAGSLNNLALLYHHMGDHARAEPLYRQSLAIWQKTLGADHPDTAGSLNNLAMLYWEMGDNARALPLIEQSLAIRQKTLGPEHSETAESLINLASFYQAMGDYAQALPFMEQSLAINKKTLGAEHPATALSLNNLATLYEDMGDYAQALALMDQSLAIRQKTLGADHPHTATSLNNLALLYRDMGDYARALPLMEQSLAIHQKTLGPEHPETANILNNLAELYRNMGDDARALPLMEQSLAIYKKTLGEEHPQTALSLYNLARLYQDMGDDAQAESACRQTVKLARINLDRTALVQSERQQLEMGRMLRRTLDLYLSICLDADQEATAAYEHVLAWKGSVFARQRATRLVRSQPELNDLFDQLQQTATQLATLSRAVPAPQQLEAWRRQTGELTERIEALEGELSRRSAPFRAEQELAHVTPDQLQAALPDDAVLIDLLEYRHVSRPPQGARAQFERRLAAIVVRPSSPIELVDLGPVDPIAAAVEAWRAAVDANRGGLTDKSPDGEESPQQTLRRLVWAPLEKHLGDALIVLISPDGALSRAPLAALPGAEPGTYLLEERALVSTPVPQLLPQLLNDEAPNQGVDSSLLLVGGVDFGASPGAEREGLLLAAADGARAAPRDGALFFGPLPGSRDEVSAISQIWLAAYADQPSDLLQADQPTEQTLRDQAPRHRYLHLATHGYFSPPSVKSALEASERKSSMQLTVAGEADRLSGFHPGLLSGLALAGANRGAEATAQPGELTDDGVMTAVEVAALDLSHSDLVVLSACETGLGKAAGGEGVLGLQRAFQSAGARTTVTSLWKVSDEATRALMIEFYKNLWQKKLSRIESLRQAQITLLNRYDRGSGALRGPGPTVKLNNGNPSTSESAQRERTPPAYWAGFVLAGDWR